MLVSDFFKTDFVDYASYDNLRKIASLVDGQKNSSRKILHTILEKSIKSEMKVSRLGTQVAEFTEYLHGSLDGVVVNLAQSFVGSNNIPLLVPEGNFGTRFTPKAAASRYIYSYGSPEFFDLFKKDDCFVLKQQSFEGVRIEPMFFVPSLPLLLINGSEGVSSGFAQKILPRNPVEIKRYIIAKLEGKNSRVKLMPWYKGFNGTIEQGDNSTQWIIKGKFKKIGINKIQITEVPIGYDLKSYLNVLDDLEEKKIIQGYTDKSEDDAFLFDVNIPSKSLKEWDDETILQKLKLISKVSENYTVIDENNKIKVFETVEEILDHYIKIKLEYLQKRKDFLIQKIEEQIKFDLSKYYFIKMIVDNILIINKRKKDDIVKDLEKNQEIFPKEGSYDYLLRLPIYSLTKEEMEKMNSNINEKKKELKELKRSSCSEIWTNEL